MEKLLERETLDLETLDYEDDAIIELPSREAMTLALCINVEVSVSIGGGCNPCNPCHQPRTCN